MRGGGREVEGFGLAEVLVALAVLGLVAGGLLALQAADLRSTRAALVQRELAAAAEAEAALRGELADPGPACLVATRWEAVASCRVQALCATCGVRLERVTVTSSGGSELRVVASGPVETALLAVGSGQ